MDKKDAINRAFQEDEAIKKASEQRSAVYLKDIEDEDEKTPAWCWNVFWCCIGIIFATSFIHFNWLQFIKNLFNI
jgi:hypothetical protein